MVNRPEFRECFAIMFDGALWDWQLIAAVSVVTFCAIILGLKKAAEISDQAIYDHYNSADLASPPSVELSHRTGNKDAW